ncbi:uncharacterized protein [Miscanthus floridulus]|uniref:uncharacterized protein n=1 Tax=Miscanthus floridulus TaxID=154761 RepID=UPI00345AF387
MASARADPKESATQGGATSVAPTQTGEGAPPPHDGEARELDGAEVPAVAEATTIEVPRVSEAEATEARAPRTADVAAAVAGAPATTEATMAEAGAPGTTKAMMAEAEAPRTTEADVIAARLSAQEVEMKAAEASVAPLVQGPPSSREGAREVEVHPISFDNTSRAQEVVDAEVADVVEQPVPSPGEGSSALVRLEKEVTQVAKASAAVQAVLETEIGEHDALKSATRNACEALEVGGVQSGSSLGSRLIALSGQVGERLRGALHMGVKRALAIIASHYIGVDLQAISDGNVLPDDDEEADEVVVKLMEAAKGPSTALAKLFEKEVVPPPPSADAEGPEP